MARELADALPSLLAASPLLPRLESLDLSMGTFVSFVACVTATFLQSDPLVGGLILLGCIGVYGALLKEEGRPLAYPGGPARPRVCC